MKKYVLLLCVASGVFTCSNQHSTNTETATVAPNVLWKTSARDGIPLGVDSVRISISSSSLSSSLVKTFAYTDNQGTIPEVQAGISITITIEGIDSLGHVLYSGSVVIPYVTPPKMEITIEANQVTPIVPSDLVAQTLSYNSIRLIWKENSTNETYYLINRQKNGLTTWDSIGIATQNTFTDSTLAPITQYQYKITAVNSAGRSTATIPADATTLILDKGGPLITITSLKKTDTVNTHTVTLYGTVHDTSGVYQVTINYVIAQLSGDQWITQNFYLGDTVNTLVIKATDNSTFRNVTLDTLTLIYKTTYVDTTNHAPVFTVTGDSMKATVKVGQIYKKVLRGIDVDANDTLRFVVSSPLSLLGKDTVMWQPKTADTGSKACYALVYDKKQAHDSIGWTITVLDSAASIPNHPPAFVTKVSEIRDSVSQNKAYCDTLIASDEDVGQTLTFSIVHGPTGLKIGGASGIITWTPADSGSFTVIASVTDDSSAKADIGWNITVVPASVKVNHPPQFVTGTADMTASGTVGKPYKDTVTAIDPDSGAILRFSVVNGPMKIDSVTGIVTWTPLTQENFTMIVSVTDDSGAHAELSWPVTVLVAAPLPPMTVSPSDGAPNQSVSPTLTWNKAADAVSYYINLATDTGFTNIVTIDSTLTDTSKAVTGLSNGTIYYWHVRAKNAGGLGNWSPRSSFTTIIALPQTPTLISPTDSATGQSLAPTLTWSTVTGSVYYHVQVSTVNTFANILIEDSTLISASKALNALANSTIYYWRVQAKNAIGVSNWAGPRSFTTIIPPSITTPPQSQTVTVGQNVTFNVTATGTVPLSYQWYKNDTAISGAISSSYSISNVQITNAGTYKVTVSNGALPNATSSGVMLTVNPAPVAPSIGSATAGDGSVAVTWNNVNGAISYNLYYKAGATVTIATGTKVTGATSPKTVTGLTNGTQYAFAVSTVGAGGVESGLSNVVRATPQSMQVVAVTYYDFHSNRTNPEFEQPCIDQVQKNMVGATLDMERKPVVGTSPCLNYCISKWFRSWVPGCDTIPVYRRTTLQYTTGDSSACSKTLKRWRRCAPIVPWNCEVNNGTAGCVGEWGSGSCNEITAVADGQNAIFEKTVGLVDTAFKNAVIQDSLTFTLLNAATGTYQFNKIGFWPLDNRGFGNEWSSAYQKRSDTISEPDPTLTLLAPGVWPHNYSFTMTMQRTFVKMPHDTFTFTGDDDAWLFINNKLVMDLGGPHSSLSMTVLIDTCFKNTGNLADTMVNNQNYNFDFFYCERHSTQSNCTITTNMLH
jgi:fibro-slime domain-containing protein